MGRRSNLCSLVFTTKVLSKITGELQTCVALVGGVHKPLKMEKLLHIRNRHYSVVTDRFQRSK